MGKIAAETFKKLKQVYGEKALSSSKTFEWFKHFRDVRESVEDDRHTGRSQSVCTPETIEKVLDMVKCDRRLTIQVLANELNMIKETVL